MEDKISSRVFLAMEAPDVDSARHIAENFMMSLPPIYSYDIGDIFQVAEQSGRLKLSVLAFLDNLFSFDDVFSVELPAATASSADMVATALSSERAYRARLVEVLGLSMAHMLDFVKKFGSTFHAGVRFYDVTMAHASMSEMQHRSKSKPELQWVVATDFTINDLIYFKFL